MLNRLMLLVLLLLLGTRHTFAQNLEPLKDIKLVAAKTGDSVTITGYSKKPILLIIFTSNYCPYSRKYEDRIEALHHKYQNRGVQLFLINPNSGPDDNLAEMKLKATANSYEYPYLSDKEQALTELLGASRTPEVFLIRKRDLSVLYHGSIDDNPQLAEYVDETYLEDAIDQALEGDEVEISQMRVVGCLIKRDS